MPKQPNAKIAPDTGKLGILVPGMDAVTTTFIAGLEAVKRGLGQPVGSGSFKTKEETKLSVLQQILQPDLYRMLYKDLYHAVRINYYPPPGDAKEGWDNIDIFGWLGYPCRSRSIFYAAIRS